MLSLGTPNAFSAIACYRHRKPWQRQVYRLSRHSPVGRLDQLRSFELDQPLLVLD